MSEAMQRAAIYARISDDRKGAGLGVQAQEKDCRDLAAKRGWTVGSVYTDNDISAYSGKPRPGYQRMLADIRAGKVDVVIAWHEDRLHRSPRELEDYIDACVSQEVVTYFAQAGELDLATSSGRMNARIRGSVARGEVEHMVERQKRAKLRRAEQGGYKGGRRPFGYEPDGVTVRVVEADAIVGATQDILSGASLASVARRWTDEGLKTSTGKDRWTSMQVREVLIRPRNAGLMEHLGQVIGKASWPAIVDEVSWSALVSLLNDPARRSTPGPERRWLGSGLFRCAACNETVICGMANGIRVYRCRKGCSSKGQQELDAMIETMMSTILPGREITIEVADDSEDRSRAVAIKARLNALAQLFDEETISAEQLAMGSRKLKAELTEIETRARESHGIPPSLSGTRDWFTSWARADLEGKRTILSLLYMVTFQKSGRGRPAGWKPGQSYFRPESVKFEPTQLGRLVNGKPSVGIGKLTTTTMVTKPPNASSVLTLGTTKMTVHYKG